MMLTGIDAMTAVLAVPAIAAALLALLPGYRAAARINMLAALLTFLAALSLLFERPRPSRYLLVDDLNSAFIVIGIFLFRIRERFETVDLQALDRFRGERR